DARGRLLGPVDSRADLGHAPGQRVLAVVEPVDLGALARELSLRGVGRSVATHRHPVARIFREQVQPLLVAALVENLGLAVDELLDLALEEETRELRLGGRSAGAHTELTRDPPSSPPP